MDRVHSLTRYGLLSSLAVIVSYVEAQIPAFFAVPGMKLGLSNTVVLTALFLMGAGSAFLINVVRILAVSFLFGNGASLIYSLSGGMLSTAVMILMKKSGRFGIRTVSVAGGVSHNLGQILAAMAVMRTMGLAWYMLILWFSGIVSGFLIGILGGELCRRLSRII